jgi:virulence-associated protein VagC
LFIKKIGDSILLTPKNSVNPWDIMFKAADKISADFMQERNQPKIQIREDIFWV